MRRMGQLERRISEQDEDFVDSRMTRSRAEGKVLALQGQQVQLDAKVSEQVNQDYIYIFSEGANQCSLTRLFSVPSVPSSLAYLPQRQILEVGMGVLVCSGCAVNFFVTGDDIM